MTDRHAPVLGVKIILMQRFRVETSDPDVTARTCHELFGNSLTFEGETGRSFFSTIDGFGGDSGFSAVRLRLPEATNFQTGELPGYSITLGVGGVNGWRVASLVGSLDVPFLLPPHCSMTTENMGGPVDLVGVGFTVDAVEKFLGHPPLRARSLEAANTPRNPTIGLRNFLVYVGDTLSSAPGIVEHPLIESSLIDSLLSLAVVTYGLSDPDAPTTSSLVPGALKRALRFIDENVNSAITTTDIAGAARMSARGLQALFSRELGITPMVYLRRLRLASARAELLDAEPESGDVASVARRWGFGHLSRFAKTYREEFGENPSETLRR